MPVRPASQTDSSRGELGVARIQSRIDTNKHQFRAVLQKITKVLQFTFRLRSLRCVETHSLPTLVRRYPRSFTFYGARPTRSILFKQIFVLIRVPSWLVWSPRPNAGFVSQYCRLRQSSARKTSPTGLRLLRRWRPRRDHAPGEHRRLGTAEASLPCPCRRWRPRPDHDRAWRENLNADRGRADGFSQTRLHGGRDCRRQGREGRGHTVHSQFAPEAAGAEAIVLTVDAPGLGTRERDVRNSFTLPEALTVENLTPLGKGNLPRAKGATGSNVTLGSGLAAYVRDNFKSDLSFGDLDWLCGSTHLPIVVKGVCRGDDARRAAEHGAKAVVVSNHGGRQLDTAPATCEVLPHVVDAAGDLSEIYVDGGIRRGSDVLKAIAFGARAALVGRPILWGLCVGGEWETGVRSILLTFEAGALVASKA